MIIWLTGQPASGKTTLAKALLERGVGDFHIDGDDLRAVQPEPYDVRGRFVNVSRAQDIALYLHNQDRLVLVSLVSPHRGQREWLKERADVVEVYLHTDEIRGREHYFAKHYEAPDDPDLDLDTGLLTVEDCVDRIIEASGYVLGALATAPPGA